MSQLAELWHTTGLYQISFPQFFMILIGLTLLYLAIKKGFEPLLLIPPSRGGGPIWYFLNFAWRVGVD
jgi:Na+-transporting methylmalonyl-CoA/oxaloacetate decarboxylase beta subunit